MLAVSVTLRHIADDPVRALTLAWRALPAPLRGWLRLAGPYGRAAALWGAGIGWPGFTTMAQSGARFIAPSADEIARIRAKHSFLKPLTLPAGSYAGQRAPIASVGSWSLILARDGLEDALAYRLARAIHRAEAGLARRLPQARETTAANTVAAAPRIDLVHPGVLRYLREIGLLA